MAAPTIDGHTNGSHSGGGNATLTLTTTQTNDIIVVIVYNELSTGAAAAVSSVTATGLTFAKRAGSNASTKGSLEVWWAASTAALTSATITVAFATTYDDASLVAYGVHGCGSLTAPWDPNAALPAHNSYTGSATPTATISTTNANDLLLFCVGAISLARGNPPSGWTEVDSNGNAGGTLSSVVAADVLGVTTTQSSLTVTYGASIGSSGGGEVIADALTATAPTPSAIVSSPAAGAVALTGYAPSADEAMAPAAGALVITGYAPSVATNISSTPAAGALLLTGYAPSPVINAVVSPASGAITLTGYAPSLAVAVAPAAGSVAFAGFAPNVAATTAPASGAITLTGYAPSPAANAASAPASGAVSLTGYAPSPVGNAVVSPASGALLLAGYAPSPVINAASAPASGALALAGYAPSPGVAVAPASGAIRFTGNAPIFTTLADLWFAPTAGFVDLTVASNRRNFISVAGAAQSLGADGSAPFETAPQVFLTSTGTPANFGANAGRGGSFVRANGTPTAGASNPPPATEATVAVSASTLGDGVLGDYLTGNLYAFNPATLTDNGTAKRWVRRWRALAGDSQNAKRFASLAIDMRTGEGGSATANPAVMLRWSDDGGASWSEPRIVLAGKLGHTVQPVRFNRLGMTRRFGGSDRIFELSSSDAFSVAIFDAEVDAS